MADRVVLLVLDHVLVGQTREIVVGLVVLAHMVEAEAVVLALVPAALRRRVETRLLAARRTRKRGQASRNRRFSSGLTRRRSKNFESSFMESALWEAMAVTTRMALWTRTRIW